MGKRNRPDVQSLTSALEELKASSAAQSTSTLTSSAATRTPSISASTPATLDEEPENEDLNNPPWHELTTTKDRGLSLTAARRIPAGTLIFAEPPLIKLSLADESDGSAIDQAFQQLSKAEKKQYMRLFNAKQGKCSEVMGIYNSNCYDIKAFDDGGGSCIGSISSRINHSCLPNTVFSYIPPELVSTSMLATRSPDEEAKILDCGLMQFRAIKNISKGRELVSNYEKSIFSARQSRIEKLRRYYGFDCTCEACMPVTEFWERSDARRKRMEELIKLGAQLERQWSKSKEEATAGIRISDPESELNGVCSKAFVALLELESLLTKEGLTYTPLANCYRSMAKWSSRNEADALPWIKKELEVVTRCFGKDCTRAKALTQDIRA